MFGLNDNDQNDSPADGGNMPTEPAMIEHPHQPDHNGQTPDSGAPDAVMTKPGPNPQQLISIKEKALSSLSPLVGHLDQTPEERFKTLMMLIQASDNSTLINEAYEAASQISDEKVRAQALLDVVNEINYFTQHPDAKSKD